MSLSVRQVGQQRLKQCDRRCLVHHCRGCVYTVENQWQTDQLQTAEQRSEPRPAASFFRIVVQLEKERQKKKSHTQTVLNSFSATV